MRGLAKIAIACGFLVAGMLPSSASAAILFDQTGSVGAGEGTESMSYDPPADVEAADDFTVPGGQQWSITEVDVIGREGDPTNLKTYVRFYASAGSVPGAQLFEQDAVVASNGPSYNSPLMNGPVLGPGTYWVSVAAPAFWHWKNSTAQTGSPAVWQNPSGLYKGGCGMTWTIRSSCYPGTESEPDQAFRLIGTQAPLPSGKPSNAFTLGSVKLNKKKGTGTLTVNVPGAGSVSISGAGLKSATVGAAAAGAVKLTVKPTGKAKKKLKKKGKAKVKASVTFRPTGGDPATQTKSLTLKKKKKKKGGSAK
jgi:hypothetical protein